MHATHPQIRKLLEHYQEISRIGKIKSVLEWDLNVNLPSDAARERAAQSAYLEEKQVTLWHDKTFRENLEKAMSQQDQYSEEEKAVVRNLAFAGKYYFNVPKELLVKKEQVTSQAFTVWKKAREENRFSDFLPFLQEIIALNQMIANHLTYKENPYDALLDLFEPELTASYFSSVFATVKPELLKLTKQVQKSNAYKDNASFINEKNRYPISDQEKLVRFLMQRMGFDNKAGRLDVSPHPFTITLSRNDVRQTTRYNEHDFRESYTSTAHETGHALYEQGVNPTYTDTPLEHGVSTAIHEALSRFWENMIGRDSGFLTFMTPLFQGFFPEQLLGTTAEDIVRSVNLVKPSFIRIEADEVTYSLHILLRFEMENALINEKISAKDAPEVWREKSKEYFGIVPKTDSEGVLQDVHWTYGAFGYFPSYALGNLYGAQFLHAMKKEVPVTVDLERGKLDAIRGWLQEHIHQYGSLYFPKDLVKKATGESLNPKYFVDYLKQKYSAIYPS